MGMEKKNRMIRSGREKKKSVLAEKVKETVALKKLKLLVTIVNHGKWNIYVDILEQYRSNFQMILLGHGTAGTEMMKMLGLDSVDKDVILSVVTEDMVPEALEKLDEKFQTVKNGDGIAFTIPFTGLIGVALYQFLSDDRTVKGGKNGK